VAKIGRSLEPLLLDHHTYPSYDILISLKNARGREDQVQKEKVGENVSSSYVSSPTERSPVYLDLKEGILRAE
jgi:hypothetical protein